MGTTPFSQVKSAFSSHYLPKLKTGKKATLLASGPQVGGHTPSFMYIIKTNLTKTK